MIAKQFDKDQDGRLNTQEKKNAVETVKNVSKLDYLRMLSNI